jgi:adenylate cyclase
MYQWYKFPCPPILQKKTPPMRARKYRELIIVAGILLLIAINLIPLSGTFFHDWSDSAHACFYYFFWAEGVFFALFALAMFAKRFIVFFIILSATALLVRLTTTVSLGDIRMHLTFWGLYSLCWVAYIEVRRGSMGLIMERRHPSKQLLVYTGYMIACIGVCFLAAVIVGDAWTSIPQIPVQLYEIVIGMAVLVPTLSIGLLKIIDMIGSKDFLPLLLGTYYKPVEQERIVLFIDIAGSTGIAERMGAMSGINLIARFIFDASGTFRLYGGDVVSYTGDGLVVTWPRRQSDRALMAVIALRERIRSNMSFYQREFGMVPDFRIGIHAGKVIVSQVGEEKLFLALYGDTVNTAGRLEQMNKELNTKVLVSGELMSNMSKHCQNLLQSLGMKILKGKDDSIEIFTLRKEKEDTG